MAQRLVQASLLCKGCSLAGFIPIGMGQMVTRRLRPDEHDSPTPIPPFTVCAS